MQTYLCIYKYIYIYMYVCIFDEMLFRTRHLLISLILNIHMLQVELGFGNGLVDDIFFVPGYDINGFVVAQVNLQ